MLISRRTFTSLASFASLGTMLANPVHATSTMNPFVTIATWKFGLDPCRKSLEVLGNGGSVLDAVEQGIWIAEADTERSGRPVERQTERAGMQSQLRRARPLGAAGSVKATVPAVTYGLHAAARRASRCTAAKAASRPE